MHPQDKKGMTQGIRDEKKKKIGERWSISAESINVYFLLIMALATCSR